MAPQARIPENVVLSRAFLKIIDAAGASSPAYAAQSNIIRDARTNLAQFYKKRETLNYHGVPNLGPLTQGVLELLLKKGFNKAMGIVREQGLDQFVTRKKGPESYRPIKPYRSESSDEYVAGDSSDEFDLGSFLE